MKNSENESLEKFVQKRCSRPAISGPFFALGFSLGLAFLSKPAHATFHENWLWVVAILSSCVGLVFGRLLRD